MVLRRSGVPAELRKLSGPSGALTGVWEGKHHTGLRSFTQFTDTGKVQMRAPMEVSSRGRWRATGETLVLEFQDERGLLEVPIVISDVRIRLVDKSGQAILLRRSPSVWYPVGTTGETTGRPVDGGQVEADEGNAANELWPSKR